MTSPPTVRQLGDALAAFALFRADTEFATAPDGVRIAFEARGESRDGEPALVLVHGWSCDRTFWSEQLGALALRRRVVAIDLAGHGESERGRRAWTIAEFGGDVAAVVERLGLARVILVGHSMGGDVVAEAARRLPGGGRVAGLVWVDTYKSLAPRRTPAQVRALVARLAADFPDSARAFVRAMFRPDADPRLVEQVAAHMASEPPAIALATLEAAAAYGAVMPATLDALRLPVIAINPDNAPTDTASLRAHGVDALVMPGVGHFAMLEAPERFNALLETAVQRLARAHAPTGGATP